MQERLKEVLDYDLETGVFTNKVMRGLHHIGEIAGGIASHGYRKINIGGRKYSAHRLVWLYVTGSWPDGDLDHKNLDKDDNRFENLRLANDSLNGANRRRRSDNTSGFKGVSFIHDIGKWRAYVGGSGSGGIAYLGCFNTPQEAHAAYVIAADKAFGEFARGA